MALSEFQIALIGAGAGVVGLVWAYNLWQERKHRQAADRLFKGDQDDVLLKDTNERVADDVVTPAQNERTEPVFVEPTIHERVEPSIPQEPPEFEEPVIAPPSPEAIDPVAHLPVMPDVKAAGPAEEVPAPAMPSSADESFAPADPMAECLVQFEVAAPLDVNVVLAACGGRFDGLTRSLQWLARNARDAAWLPVQAGDRGSFTRWMAGLQLADRRGPVSDAELGQFLEGVQGLAAQLGTEAQLPPRGEVLQRAQALDAFCASVDVQFGLYLVESSGGSFPGTKLRGVCEAAGLILEADGAFHSRDDAGREQFWISNGGSERFEADTIRSMTTHGITFTIDVPRVANGPFVFDRMLASAQQMARGLGGVLVDAQRQPLAEPMIKVIRAKIIELQQQMQAADIAPGSPRALKLFS